jgi:hypothetical protein
MPDLEWTVPVYREVLLALTLGLLSDGGSAWKAQEVHTENDHVLRMQSLQPNMLKRKHDCMACCSSLCYKFPIAKFNMGNKLLFLHFIHILCKTCISSHPVRWQVQNTVVPCSVPRSQYSPGSQWICQGHE